MDVSGTVDKFRCFRLPAVAIICFFLFGSFAATAQESTWSFQKNPQPDYTEATIFENIARKAEQSPDKIPEILVCNLVVDTAYRIYQDQYPDFAQLGNEGDNLWNWKQYAAGIDVILLDSCVFAVTMDKINYISGAPLSDFYFCGIYSRPPVSETETQLAALIDKLIVLSKIDGEVGAINFSIANTNRDFVIFSPGMKYFFSRIVQTFLQPVLESEFDADLAEKLDPRFLELINQEPNISDDRRRFIENAVKNLDLQIMLETTQSCLPRPPVDLDI